MDKLQIGTLVWTNDFYFPDIVDSKGKDRPSMVLGYTDNRVTLVQVTSYTDVPWFIKGYSHKKYKTKLWYGDVDIHNWKDIDILDKTSVIRTQSIIQVRTSSLNKNKIGPVVPEDIFEETMRYITAIEGMYFNVPYFFEQWCVRYQPKYHDYLNINTNCKMIRDLHEGVELNSLDVMILTATMCRNLEVRCCLSGFLWRKGNVSKYHFFCIWEDYGNYMELTEKDSLRYLSVHCMYNGYAMLVHDDKSKSFKEATEYAANMYCKHTNLKYVNEGHYYYKDNKDLIKWATTFGYMYTQREVVNKIFGSTPQIDASFEH